jgi:hypothetical protein
MEVAKEKKKNIAQKNVNVDVNTNKNVQTNKKKNNNIDDLLAELN